MNRLIFTALASLLVSAVGFSSLSMASDQAATSSVQAAPNMMDELNPFDPNIEELLKKLDAEQEAATGMPSRLDGGIPMNLGEGLPEVFLAKKNSCYRATCKVWAQIVKSTQVLYIYVDGVYTAGYYVSTGLPQYETPTFDTHPNGRIYDKYTSTKYPDGDYNGLGNMPYAVFISGGFAVHGTTMGNVKRLGRKASHGCIRVHPDVGHYFNRLVRATGVKNTWITIQE